MPAYEIILDGKRMETIVIAHDPWDAARMAEELWPDEVASATEKKVKEYDLPIGGIVVVFYGIQESRFQKRYKPSEN